MSWVATNQFLVLSGLFEDKVKCLDFLILKHPLKNIKVLKLEMKLKLQMKLKLKLQMKLKLKIKLKLEMKLKLN